MTKPLAPLDERKLAALDKSWNKLRAEEAHLVGIVGQLRYTGVSWEIIGRTLGMTKQGAQQRFGA